MKGGNADGAHRVLAGWGRIYIGRPATDTRITFRSGMSLRVGGNPAGGRTERSPPGGIESGMRTQEARASLTAGGLFWRGVLWTAAVFACLGALEGCTTSQWEQNYVGASGAAPLSKGAPVQLREVP